MCIVSCLFIVRNCSLGGLCGHVDKRQNDESTILWYVALALAGTDHVLHHQTEDTLSPFLRQCESYSPSIQYTHSLQSLSHTHTQGGVQDVFRFTTFMLQCVT